MAIEPEPEVLPVKIRVGRMGVESRIELAGVDVSRFVRGFKIDSYVHELSRLTIDFVKVEVDAEGVIDVSTLGDVWADYRRARDIKEGSQ